MQVAPIKPTLKAPGTKRSQLKYHRLPSNVAFNFNLRRYTVDAVIYCGDAPPPLPPGFRHPTAADAAVAATAAADATAAAAAADAAPAVNTAAAAAAASSSAAAAAAAAASSSAAATAAATAASPSAAAATVATAAADGDASAADKQPPPPPPPPPLPKPYLHVPMRSVKVARNDVAAGLPRALAFIAATRASAGPGARVLVACSDGRALQSYNRRFSSVA